MEAMFSSNILPAMPKTGRDACRSQTWGLGVWRTYYCGAYGYPKYAARREAANGNTWLLDPQPALAWQKDERNTFAGRVGETYSYAWVS